MKKISIVSTIGVLIFLLLGCNASRQSVLLDAPTTSQAMSEERDGVTEENSYLSGIGRSKVSNGNIVYQKGGSIFLFDPLKKEKQLLFSDKELVDFDLSDDGRLLAYTLKESGFDGNSDLYILDLTTHQTLRLTQQNDTASFEPHFFHDNRRVAYVSRIFDEQTKTLSAGEIRIIDVDGNIHSSKTLVKAPPFNANEDCTEEELHALRIGILDIRPTNDALAYWYKNQGGYACDMVQSGSFLTLGSRKNFQKEKILRLNETFEENGSAYKRSLVMDEVLFLEDGRTVTTNFFLPPDAGHVTFFYDKNQNKIWEIDERLEDLFPYGSEGTFLFAFPGSYAEDGKNVVDGYFLEEAKIGDQIQGPSSVADFFYKNSPGNRLRFLKILNDHELFYVEESNGSDHLYLYDFKAKSREKIDSADA